MRQSLFRRLSCRVRYGLTIFFLILVQTTNAYSQTETVTPKAVETSETFFQWMVRASGPLGALMLVMSFYLTTLIVWMFFEYRRSRVIPEKLTTDIAELIRLRRFNDIPTRLSADESFLAETLKSGLRKLSTGGLTSAQAAMTSTNEAETMAMEHRTTYLATVGTLGPMIGLLGTVYGMILSFRVMATAGSNPQASQLAAGISTALFATLEGIAISIPAIFFYAFFRNRISLLSLEVEIASNEILEAITNGLRPEHPIYSNSSLMPGNFHQGES